MIEGRNHRLGDVRKEVVDAEASTGERIDPVGLQETADDELKQKTWSGRPLESGDDADENVIVEVCQFHDHADEHKETKMQANSVIPS